MNGAFTIDPADTASYGHPLHTLYAKVKGRIVRADNHDYDTMRALPMANWNRRPALIVRVADAEDVVAALAFARLTGMEVAVRSGGHSTGDFGGDGLCPSPASDPHFLHSDVRSERTGVQCEWVQDCFEATRKEQAGVYGNFLAEEGEARTREAYPETTWKRLRQIKQRYDPENLFHLNQNIPPAEASAA